MRRLGWRWRGKDLAHPLTILRRLVALPLLLAGKVAVFVSILLGWGLDEAVDAWGVMP